MAIRGTIDERLDAQRALTDAAQRTYTLSEARYRGGLDDHLRYLDAQRTDYASQMALIEVRPPRQIALSTLFRALGGGWWGELSPRNPVSVR